MFRMVITLSADEGQQDDTGPAPAAAEYRSAQPSMSRTVNGRRRNVFMARLPSGDGTTAAILGGARLGCKGPPWTGRPGHRAAGAGRDLLAETADEGGKGEVWGGRQRKPA
jgi:hypothetical protein